MVTAGKNHPVLTPDGSAMDFIAYTEQEEPVVGAAAGRSELDLNMLCCLVKIVSCSCGVSFTDCCWFDSQSENIHIGCVSECRLCATLCIINICYASFVLLRKYLVLHCCI